MTNVKKPSFPNPSVAELKSSLDTLGAAIQGAKGADGKVDVTKLEQSIGSAGPAAEIGLDRIKDAYRRTEMVSFRDSCSGSTVTRPTKVAPKTLEAGEVQSVLQAIIQAKSKVQSLDSSGDGKLQEAEAKAAGGLSGLAGELASGALAGTLTAYRLELRAWNDALNEVADDIERRTSFDHALSNAAEFHAESSAGAEAIKWAYRELATMGKKADIWELRETLENAETSFLRWIPFFGRNVKKKENHLSDAEVRKLLKTDDLAGFANAKKAAVTARVGDYEASYLKGTDLPGSKDLGDPAFHRVHSSC